MWEKVIISLILLGLTLFVVLFLLPFIFNQIKELYYLKHGSGIRKSTMYYNANKGEIGGSEKNVVK